MQLLTWNINRYNKRINEIPSAIQSFDADVVCLQEVPQSLIPELEKLTDYALFICDEYARPNRDTFSKMAILSRLPVVQNGIVDHREESNSFISLHHKFQGGAQQALESQYIDIELSGKVHRIFNTHLPLSVPPRIRMQYLDNVLTTFDNDCENLICGDFNPVGKFPFHFFWGWAHSYRLRDYLSYEPLMLRKRMKENDLKNLFRFKCTHPITRQQLDYILAPKHVEIKQKKVIKKRFKSDHRALMVELAA